MIDSEGFLQLLEKAKQGDRSATDRILREYGTQVLTAIRVQLGRRLRQKLDSMDIFQTAVKSALGGLDRFEGNTPEAFVAWLTGIARHDILDKAKYFGSEKHHQDREQPLVRRDDSHSGEPLQLPGPGASPSQIAVGEEGGFLLAQIIDQLDDELRPVARLKSAGLSSAEVSRELGISERTVRRRYAEALTKIRKELEIRGYGGA